MNAVAAGLSKVAYFFHCLDAPSSTITLNAIEITFGAVTSGGQTAQVSLDPAKEQATFTFPQPLPAGKNTLAITYTGILNDKLRGFYLSKTKARNYAVTQFESTDARRALALRKIYKLRENIPFRQKSFHL